jgi:hypothetical protein
MTRLTSSTLMLATTASVSAGLTAVIALLLTGTGQAQTVPAAKPVSVQTAQVSVSAATATAPAIQLAQGRDGQRTVRVVYAGAIVAR